MAQAGRMELQYPQTVATYTTYEDAQAAVDFLSDKQFPVENLMIVGTNLRLVERVTGRRTWGSVVSQGAVSGIGTGMLVGIMMALFLGEQGNLTFMLLIGLALGVTLGILTGVIAHAVSQGKRDFNSMRQTVASTYEVLAEHKVVQQARELLATKPGERMRMFDNPQ